MQLSIRSVEEDRPKRRDKEVKNGAKLNELLTGVAIGEDCVLLAYRAVHGSERLNWVVRALHAALESAHSHRRVLIGRGVIKRGLLVVVTELSLDVHQ